MRRERQKNAYQIGLGTQVEAIVDDALWVTASGGPQYRAGDRATVIAVRASGGLELQFSDGRIPTIKTETLGNIRRIAFDSRDFKVVI